MTCCSKFVRLCIAADRANNLVLTGVLELPSDSQMKFLPVHFYSYCCKPIPEMFHAHVSITSLRRTPPNFKSPFCNYVSFFVVFVPIRPLC